MNVRNTLHSSLRIIITGSGIAQTQATICQLVILKFVCVSNIFGFSER